MTGKTARPFGDNPGSFLANLRNMRARRMNLDLDAIEKLLLARRKEARDRKDFAASDSCATTWPIWALPCAIRRRGRSGI